MVLCWFCGQRVVREKWLTLKWLPEVETASDPKPISFKIIFTRSAVPFPSSIRRSLDHFLHFEADNVTRNLVFLCINKLYKQTEALRSFKGFWKNHASSIYLIFFCAICSTIKDIYIKINFKTHLNKYRVLSRALCGKISIHPSSGTNW